MKISSATAVLDAPEALPETPLDNFGAALDFLRLRFPELPVGSYINLRTIDRLGHPRNSWYPTPEEAARAAAGQPEGSAVYYGVNPRLDGRGDKGGVTFIGTLHADLDSKDFGSPEEALQALDDFDCEASLVVHSGGGLHAYWHLAGLLEATPEAIAYVENLHQRLYFRLGSGKSLDAVHDVSRILRVPGSTNWKKADAPRPVRTIRQGPAAYVLKDFEDVLPSLPLKPSRAIGGLYQNSYDSPDEKQLAEMLAHIPPTLPYGDWIGVVMAVHSVYPDDRGLNLVKLWCNESRYSESQGQMVPENLDRRWRGFRRQGYSVGTIVKLAMDGGWTPPQLASIRHGTRVAPPPGAGVKVVRQWQRVLLEYPEVRIDELPPALQAVARHIQGQSVAFEADWAQMLSVSFWSLLFPSVRFENLNLCLWYLGLGPQGVGKNRTSDELYETFKDIWIAQGEEIIPFTSGSTMGMLRRFEGDNRRMIAYFAEYMGFMKGLKSDYTSNLPEMMCNIYDGRPLAHQLAKEEIVGNNPYATVIATTTPRALRDYGSRDDLNNGYLSRFWMCAPNCLDVQAERNRTPEERQEVVDTVTAHLEALPPIRRAEYDTPGATLPPCLTDYMAALGMNTGRVRDLEEEMDSDVLPAGRLIARVKKVSALLELAEVNPRVVDGTLYVTERNARLAVRLVQRANAYAQRAGRWVSANAQEGAGEKIMLKLSEVPEGLTARELQQKTHYAKRELEAALELLLDDGSINHLKVGKKVLFTMVQ